ncbi:MAG TPA: glycosyltransferase, partial [Candidatus Methylomirabilis sp.]|nr:glycosyltransferase [Candidatus Methylomirabilis sp.]
ALANRRGTYKASFQYSTQMLPNWVREADVALVIRPYREHERLVMDQGLAAGLPMGVYLDDDFLALHEYGPPFDYMAPGTLGRRNLVEILERADAVWVTSRFIAESVRPLNRRIVPHQGTVPHEWLPADVPSRDPQRARRIGCVGTSFREEELRALWEALVRLSREYGTRLEFEFWGLDVSSLPALAAPVRQVPYETSYFRFMLRLQEADFDILVTPLFDRPRARLAKAPSKYFQVAAAGALGVFSRVPPYERLPEGLTCLKAENTVSEWYRVLREAVEMPAERFDLMRRRTLAHVREEFTETAEIDLHEAAWRATEFHAKTRAARDADGRPRVVYALGMADGELDVRLLRWLDVAQQYAVAPLVLLRRGLELTAAGRRLLERLVEDGVPYEVVPLDALDGRLRVLAPGGERERHELQALLERVSPALVHTLGVLPLVGQVSASLGLPHVASLYAVPDEASWHEAPGSHRVVNHSDSLRYAARWREWLGSEKFCAREPVPQASIDLGLRRHLETLGADPPPRSAGSTRIVVAAPFREGGGQLEAIGAATALKRRGLACELLLCGNTEPDPDYLQRCRQRIEIAGLSAHVALHGAVHDWLPPLENADLVLSPATWGDFPLAMKDAMAIGVLVVATPVGGVPEIVLDGVSGILCADGSAEAIADALARAIALSPDERRRIVEQARRVARSEFHPQRAASDLLDMYIRAIDLARGTRSRPQGRPAAAPDRRSQPRVAERVDQPAHPPASHVELRHALTYRLVPRDRSWHGLDVLVGTHQRTASGRLDLALLSPAGDVLRTACVDLATARDNDWLAFTFAPIHNAAGRPFLLRFSLANPGPDTRLSLYDLAPLPTRLTTRALRRLHPPATRDSLYCRLRYAHREDVD